MFIYARSRCFRILKKVGAQEKLVYACASESNERTRTSAQAELERRTVDDGVVLYNDVITIPLGNRYPFHPFFATRDRNEAPGLCRVNRRASAFPRQHGQARALRLLAVLQLAASARCSNFSFPLLVAVMRRPQVLYIARTGGPV